MKRVKKILLKTAVIIFWLLIWQTVSLLVNRELLIDIPSPLSTLNAVFLLCQRSLFWESVAGTLIRVITGFFSALFAGMLIAWFSHKNEFVYRLFSPLLRLMRAVPVAAFIFLVFLWVQKDAIPTLIAFLTVLPIVAENLRLSLCAIDKNLIEMAKVMEMKRGQIFRFIIYPSVKPAFTSSVINGLGFAFKAGVAAEVICKSAESLGELLWVGKNNIDYDEVFAVTAVIVFLSVAIEGILKYLLKEKKND